jgi:hypothetical protein
MTGATVPRARKTGNRPGHADCGPLDYMTWGKTIHPGEVAAAWVRADDARERSIDTRFKAQEVVAYSRDLRERRRNERREIRDRLAQFGKKPRHTPGCERCRGPRGGP